MLLLDILLPIIIIKTMKNIESLQFHNFGRSRGRLMLVNKPNHPGPPGRILGTRWIAFGTAVYDLTALITANSYLQLNERIPGGLTSNTWQTIKASPGLEYVDPVSIATSGLITFNVHNFGADHNRIVLIGTPASSLYAPSRIGSTSFIALNPAAHRAFTAWFKTLPGGTSSALAAFTAVPGGLGGGTLNRLRAVLAT